MQWCLVTSISQWAVGHRLATPRTNMARASGQRVLESLSTCGLGAELQTLNEGRGTW